MMDEKHRHCCKHIYWIRGDNPEQRDRLYKPSILSSSPNNHCVSSACCLTKSHPTMFPSSFTTLSLPVLLFLTNHPTPIRAWGALGHETIAYIASSYVTDTTRSTLQSILSDTSDSYLANVSTWADSYRYTTAGAWSKPLHFIDAHDSPPDACNVNYGRDCGTGGCVVSAVVNYTSILLDNGTVSEFLSDASTSVSEETYDALKFLVHFIGDMHQPLHDEAIDVGGNDISVTFDGESTNLHHIWDTEIVDALAGVTSESISKAETFANTLLGQIEDPGDLGWNVSSWFEGATLDDVLGTAMGWVSEANGYVCSDVLVGGVDAVEGVDLGGAYLQNHEGVARVQIARAGVRLGMWLNLMFDQGGNGSVGDGGSGGNGTLSDGGSGGNGTDGSGSNGTTGYKARSVSRAEDACHLGE